MAAVNAMAAWARPGNGTGPNQARDAEAERVAAVLEVLRRLLDRDDDRRGPGAGEVGRDLQADDRLAGAALAGDERRSSLGNAAERQDVKTRNPCFKLLQRAH